MLKLSMVIMTASGFSLGVVPVLLTIFQTLSSM